MKRAIFFIIVVISCLSCSAQADNVIFGNLSTIAILKNNKLQFYYRDILESSPNNSWDLSNLQFSNWQRSDVADFYLPEGYKYIFDVSRMNDGRYTTMILVDNRIQIYFYENDNWQINNERNITLPDKYKYCFFDSNRFHLFVFLDNELLTYDIYNNRQVGNSQNFTLPNGYKNVFYSSLLGRQNMTGRFLGVHINDKIQFYNDEWQVLTNTTFNLPRGSRSVFNIYNGFGVLVNNEVHFYLLNRVDWDNMNWLEKTDWLFVLPE
jgi:hypothetical protein